MRAEKQYLVEEVSNHLGKSDFVFLTNYERITVAESRELRSRLSERGAEFHVVKNSVLDVAAQGRNLPGLDAWLAGPTAIVVGGQDPCGVANTLRKFFREKKKNEVKVGLLGEKTLEPKEVNALADLPSIEALQSQLLNLFNAPATRMACLLNAVPTSVVTVLKARADKENGEN